MTQASKTIIYSLFILAMVVIAGCHTEAKRDAPEEKKIKDSPAIQVEQPPKRMDMAEQFRAGKMTVFDTECQYFEPPPEISAQHYKNKYHFTSDWFTPNLPAWRAALGHLRGKPDIHYLEVGLYEGRSAVWVLENILTEPSSKLTGIDIFPGQLEQVWQNNLKKTGRKDQAITIKAYSQKALRRLPLNSYDIIYIDGSHTGWDVLADIVLAWDLLKENGVMIFDDYRWRRGKGLPAELQPGPAIESVITMYRDSMHVIHRCYQLMVQKRSNPCLGREYCSQIGQYAFLWRTNTLLDLSNGTEQLEKFPLNPEEAIFLQRLFHSRQFGRISFHVPDDLMQSNAFNAFIKRTNMEFVLPQSEEMWRLSELHGAPRYTADATELVVRDYFKNRWDGSFASLGAEGNLQNNDTYFLEKHLGWSGILYSPNTEIVDALKTQREKSKVVSSSSDISLQKLGDNIDALDYLSINQLPDNFDIESLNPRLVSASSDKKAQGVIEYLKKHGYKLVEKYAELKLARIFYSKNGK